MTAILGQRTDEPVICGCCGRAAGTIGAIEVPGFKPVLWCCEACRVTDALKVIDMNTMKLDALESEAMRKAIDEVAQPIAEQVMTALWDQGIRDLSALDGEAFSGLVGKLKSSKEFQGAAALLLVTYSNAIRTAVAKEKVAK